MSYFKVKSHAKINLALNVIGKTNLLHKIESIICFSDFHDEIIIQKIISKSHKIKFIGKFAKTVKSKNTISQLLKYLDQKKLLKDKYQVIIKKNIPTKSGLGGGSMNAASLLNFFIKKRLVILKKKEIIKILDTIGSDTKLGLYSKNLILKSNNSIKVLARKFFFHILIVKPNFGCSTREIFSKVKKFSKPKFDNVPKYMLSPSFLKDEKNDLESIAMSKYPKLKILKNFLEKLPKSEFVRMTGSGSAIIVYFNSSRKSKEAEKKVKKKFRNYWCKTSKTI